MISGDKLNFNENLISIIVPVYNAERFISNTIDMVVKQTFTDWELILVDDGSKDNSVSVINDWIKNHNDERVRSCPLAKGKCAAAARNYGLSNARGRYIAFLDADDVWFPDKLEKELAFMKKKNAGFVFTAYEFGDENAVGTGKVVNVPEVLTYKQALSRTIIFTTTTMFDTNVIPRDLLIMPEVPSEDTATWWTILKSGYNAYGLNEVTTIYRRPAKSLSSNKLVALKRIWFLYRNIANLSIPSSIIHFIGWAFRATIRRI